MNILDAMRDPELFGPFFGKKSWSNWQVCLKAIFGLEMSAGEREIFTKHTGRSTVPTKQANETFLICGRRAGKSLIASLIGSYVSAFYNYTPYLSPGERGVVMLLAADKSQARVIFRYVDAFFEHIPLLNRLVVNRTRESIDLSNGISVEIHSSDFRSVRGRTLVAALLDELAFWPQADSVSPDSETLAALRPAMATIPSALLIALSSPYSKRGAVYEAHRDYYAKDDAPVLVWRASTLFMNPTISKLTLATARLRDPISARSEYDAEFRDDIESFLPLEVIESCIVRDRRELLPFSGVTYHAFCDPSGGRSDSMTLGIAHYEKNKVVLDLLREVQPPFSPEAIVREFADTLHRYSLSSLTGDKYGAEWIKEAFQRSGIQYRSADKTRSEIYLEALPALTSQQVELLDNPRLVAQLAGLERRTGRSGKDAIDHRSASHDDLSNAACGVLIMALGGAGELPLVEFFKSGQAERMLADLEAVTTVKRATKPETPSFCPGCGGPRARIGGVGLRCNGCGNVYANESEREPISVPQKRGSCCDNPLPQRIAGITRCGNCGAQSNAARPRGISRRDVATFDGGRAQLNPQGFLPHAGACSAGEDSENLRFACSTIPKRFVGPRACLGRFIPFVDLTRLGMSNCDRNAWTPSGLSRTF